MTNTFTLYFSNTTLLDTVIKTHRNDVSDTSIDVSDRN